MSIVAIVTIPTTAETELGTFAGLVEKVASSSVQLRWRLHHPRRRAWQCIGTIVTDHFCPLGGMLLRAVIDQWELRPHLNGITVCGETGW
jgi:hypothetical protein